jgi:hypothetical protein
MFNWIKLISLKIYKWWIEDEDNKEMNFNPTYTQVCLHCYKSHQYYFYGVVPNKHTCPHCKQIF